MEPSSLLLQFCAFIYPPTVSVKTERAARNEVKELGSDTETWSQYIRGIVPDKEFSAQLIAVGNSIIALLSLCKPANLSCAYRRF